MSRTKIVYTILGTYNCGGMERVLASKANYFVSQGFQVIIITTDQKERKPYFDFDPRVQHIDLQINYTSSAGLLKKLICFPFKQRKHFSKLRRVLEELKPDICISMFDHDVSLLYKINDGSKKVLEAHFSRYKKMQYARKGLWGIIDRYTSAKEIKYVRAYDRFVVLTGQDKSLWGENLAHIRVIGNASSLSPNTSAPLENKQVIAIGRYDYQKGFDELISIWRLVASKHPDWKLVIYGNGPLRQQYLEQIESLGLKGKVILKDPIRDIQKAYLESSMLVMSSRYEGLPMALIEASSCGLPLISYNCKCGPGDIIAHGKNGFLVDPGNQKQMADYITQLIENKVLRDLMGEEAKRSSKNYTKQVIMDKWLDLFKQLES